MSPLRHPIAALLAVVLAAAGCGGGDDGGSGERLSRAEFTDKAGEICQSAGERYAEINTALVAKVQADPGNQQQAIEESLEQVAPVVKDIVEQIGELQPPEEMQGKLDAYVTQASAAADEIAADPAKFARIGTSGETAFPGIGPLSRDLGLDQCGPSGN